MDRRALLSATGATALATTLVACGSSAPAADSKQAATSSTGPGEVVRGSFASRFRHGKQTPWVVHYPPGHARGSHIPVLICLHGTDEDENTPTILRWPANSVLLEHEGLPPFACAGIGGGERTFWRPRADGSDTGSMVTQEFVPLLQGLGLDVQRPALYGFSMGAMGALWLASREVSRVSSITLASCPFPTAWDAVPTAYDSPADFQQNDGRILWNKLRDMGIRVDIGWHDPFLQQNWAFIPHADPTPDFHVTSGGHDHQFWGAAALDQLRFVGHNFS